MLVRLIVALTAVDGGLGWQNRLPWPKCRNDLRHFARLTRYAAVIMGRQTFLSLGARPLSNRINIILTSQPNALPPRPDVVFCISLQEALAWCQAQDVPDVWLIGGAKVYQEALQTDVVDECYVTVLHQSWPADVFFPLEALETAAWRKTLLHREECDPDLQCKIEYWCYKRWLPPDRIVCCSTTVASSR
jgi:dihydrofolate reductase